ncbi:long-chain fatty acid--CoA ligase [Streptomyces sp. NA04227]|uniref:AMP-dependent synthetase/ligase n=1 Tax=Streptomyces sp. NA04227 TaxID=2742136 RepID=UPI00158FF1AF|nr:AMP-dependent synthetase/ligase [Streptomyces sp. NA04227]QKW11052.1 long-chain fatty acid--CoA ligase [Streptomyces sp. NA04227]
MVREVSMPLFVTPPEHGSLADIPFDNAAEEPGAAVLARKDAKGRWRDVTAADFAAEVLALAKGLVAQGLQPGDRLAIMARTTYEWTLLDFAAWAAGLVTVPVYPTSSAFQTRAILQDCGAVALAVETGAQAAALGPERDRIAELRYVWTFDKGDLGRLAELGNGHGLPDLEIESRRAALTPEHTATLMYTSGTTGRPKGCALSHANVFAAIDNAIELLHPVFKAATDEPPSTLLFLPLSHVFGRMVAIGCLRARVRLGHAPSTATGDLLADLDSFGPTFLFAIPYVLEKVFNTGRATAERLGRVTTYDRAARIARRYGAEVEAQQLGTGPGPGTGLKLARGVYDPLVYRRIRAALGGRVRYIVSGGSPLGRRLGTFYTGAGIELFEGYGLTETSAAITVNPPQQQRLGSVGRPMPGMSVRLADDGEVLLKGPHVIPGYWDTRTGDVKPATDAEDWLHTGDIGTLDGDGYLSITGRKSEMIITNGGKKAAPAPLEDWLRAHPLINHCMVVGDNRPYIGALITLDPEGIAHWQQMRRKNVPLAQLAEDPELHETLQRAVDEANKLVSRPESIREFVVLTEQFTEEAGHLTPSAKLKRAAVAADFAAQLEALYANYGAGQEE